MNRTNYRTVLWAGAAALLLLPAGMLHAQDSARVITLEQAVQAALASNQEIRLATLSEQAARAGYAQTSAVFLPQVAFSYTAITTNNPLNAFGFQLQQRMITQNNFNPALLNHPGNTADVVTRLEIQQPVINPDKWYMRRGAASQAEAATWTTQRTREAITFETQKAWQQLQLAWKAVEILEQAVQTAQAVYTFTGNRYQQGYLQKSDLLNAQVQVKNTESELHKAQSNRADASDYLLLLMGQKTTALYKPEGRLPATIAAEKQAQLNAGRADFMAMQKAIEAGNYQIQASQKSYWPQLNAFGSFQYNDKRLTGFGANAYLAGIQLQWKVFSGNSVKHTIARQKLERDQLTQRLEQAQDAGRQELASAQRSYEDAVFYRGQYQLTIDQAAEALRVLQNRYGQGLANTTDVLLAATRLLQQQLALAQVQCNLEVTAFYIQFLTTTTNK